MDRDIGGHKMALLQLGTAIKPLIHPAEVTANQCNNSM